MSTRANVLVVEKNGDWEKTSQFYRHCDGYVEEMGKDLAILAYMAKKFADPDTNIDDAGNETKRDNFKRIRNRFFGYLNDSPNNYEAEDFDGGVHGDIEYLYLVKIQRDEYDSVVLTVEFIEIPMGSNPSDYVQKILNGEGIEIELQVK